jgi:hypothetical protein
MGTRALRLTPAKRHGSLRLVAGALMAGLALSGCSTDIADQNESDVLLLISEIDTQAGGSGDTGVFLLSDVIRVEDPTGFFNDNATLSVQNIPKNPNGPTQSNYSDVLMERYTVRYFRSDGLNAEGVDVPYSFQGPLGGTIPAGDEAEVALILVRHTAKLEPPLNQLQNTAGLGGVSVLATFAEVTIYGRTLNGKVVSAKTTISVTFADFGD